MPEPLPFALCFYVPVLLLNLKSSRKYLRRTCLFRNGRWDYRWRIPLKSSPRQRKTLLNNSVKAGVDGISLKELYWGLVFAKCGLSWAGFFRERSHLIGGNLCASPGSSQELLDICTKLLEESWSLSFRRSLFFVCLFPFCFGQFPEKDHFYQLASIF